MKYLVASDFHGSVTALTRFLQAFEHEKPDCLILLGDLLHGHYDTDTEKVGYALADLPCPKLACMGNCDFPSDEAILGFPLVEAGATYFEGRCVHYQHHPFYVAFPPGDICLFGHTHVKVLYKAQGVVYLNPGSVALPRDSCPSYAIMEDKKLILKNLLDFSEIESLVL